jgi:chromosome segregation ATPase
MTNRYEREVAEHKRARADLAAQRDRIEELRGELADRDEHARAGAGVADELRDELAGARGELEQLREEHEHLGQAVAARELTAARADDEATRLREAVADRDRRLAELTRGRDDVRTQINAQKVELDRLREVIGEQERMLEERRVSLVTRDEVIVKLRSARTDTSVLDAARDIHDAINDRLSELRNHGEVVRHEAPSLDGEPARVQAVREAADALVEVADAAKRELRRLRELADQFDVAARATRSRS